MLKISGDWKKDVMNDLPWVLAALVLFALYVWIFVEWTGWALLWLFWTVCYLLVMFFRYKHLLDGLEDLRRVMLEKMREAQDAPDA